MDKNKSKIIVTHFFDSKMALGVANSNVGLKLSLFKNGLKRRKGSILRECYGFLQFTKFNVSLVYYLNDLAWLIKVVEGEMSSTEFIKLPLINKKIDIYHNIGEVDEESNIWCIVTVLDGHYFYCDEVDEKNIVSASKDDLDNFFDNYEKYNNKKIKRFDW